VTSSVAKLRVLVVDDSPVARRLLVHIINGDSEMEVVGEASDGDEAVAMAGRLEPDVILMDIVLPGTDGLAATRTIMNTRPTPIVLISSAYRTSDARKTFEALASGALTVLPKPTGPGTQGFAEEVANLTITVKLMAEVKLVRRRRGPGTAPAGDARTMAAIPTVEPVEVIAIAASTGGPAALASVLAALPGSMRAPILVVQHITSGFHQGLVSWLDSVTPLPVRLAEDGQPIRRGEVLVGPSGKHLGVTRAGRVVLSADAPMGGHRPSATHLFRSVAQAYGPRAIGVILTGMGDDGAAGLEALRRAGGIVVAQDEATSVVYGMPREAAALGVVNHVVPLDLIPATLTELMNGGKR
jgi:two-component system chemotaxis response regulator CheB